MVGSPCSPRDSQESSPAPQFQSINSLVLSLLCGPSLISVHDYWKNHSFDYMDLCSQSDVSEFNILSRFVKAFLPRRKHLLISWLWSLTALISVQFSSVSQSCLTLCNPMHCSMPGFPVHHQLPELTQTHVHRVSDAIQPSHPLLSPSPLAFNLSQHQGLFI